MSKKKKKREKLFLLERLFCLVGQRFCRPKKNKIVMCSPLAQQYNCNPKYIFEEIEKRKIKDLDIVWLYAKHTKKEILPSGVRKVKYNSVKGLYELVTASGIITNSHMFLPYKLGYKKHPKTLYFQTWHGSMGIKKADLDAKDTYKNIGWLDWQTKSAMDFDYVFVDSDFEAEVYKTQLLADGKTVKLGKARDSIFYKDHTPYINKVKEYYNIPKENKILLYAPTWRADGRCSCYNLDTKMLKSVLSQRFGGNWSILVRPHVHMKKEIFNALFNENEVINTIDYIDMQELMVAADALISDYSSCLPEYTILKRPAFTYASDIDQYENGLYYPLSELPGPLATNNYELATNILNFDENLFQQRAEQFLKDKGHEDDENSCVRIVDFILEKLGENK